MPELFSCERTRRCAGRPDHEVGGRATTLGALSAVLDRLPRTALGAPAELSAAELPAALQALVELADTTRPELKAQDHVVEARERSLTLARMGDLPDFEIGGQYIVHRAACL